MEAAGPVGFDDDVVIKEITLTIDYVSYADQTSYGSAGEGERRIMGMLDGARRYDAWLVLDRNGNGPLIAALNCSGISPLNLTLLQVKNEMDF